MLRTYKFAVLGDQVVTEVLADAPDGRKSGNARGRGSRKTRTRLLFDRMHIPFSVGQGQFVLHNSSVNGPLIGATMRGKVDFNRGTVNLGGFKPACNNNMIVADGVIDPPVADSADPTLASVFCIGPTNPAVDTVAGLPGPGRVTLFGTGTGYCQAGAGLCPPTN